MSALRHPNLLQNCKLKHEGSKRTLKNPGCVPSSFGASLRIQPGELAPVLKAVNGGVFDWHLCLSLLELGIVSFVLRRSFQSLKPTRSTRAWLCMPCRLNTLFDIYVIFQQAQFSQVRKRFREREELFRLISENAADMIAVVDAAATGCTTAPRTRNYLDIRRKN